KWGGSGNSCEAPDSSRHLSGVPRQPSSRSGSSGGSTKQYYRRPFCCSVLLVGGSTAPRGGTTACVRAVGVTVGFPPTYLRGSSSPKHRISLARVCPPLLTFFELANSQSLQ